MSYNHNPQASPEANGFPPFPPCPHIPRGPVGPPGPPGPPGLPGSMNTTAMCFVYAQLAHLLQQLIDLYPGLTLYVFLPGISPVWVSGVPYQVYKSADGTYGGLFVIDGGEVAFPLSAIAALEFADDIVYNPSITYLSKPSFPPGCDTNIITAIHDYMATLSGEILFNIGSTVHSTGPTYLNKYGLIVQADASGNNPSFIPITHITCIAPQDAAKAANTSDETKTALTTRVQVVT